MSILTPRGYNLRIYEYEMCLLLLNVPCHYQQNTYITPTFFYFFQVWMYKEEKENEGGDYGGPLPLSF